MADEKEKSDFEREVEEVTDKLRECDKSQDDDAD